MPDLIVNDVSNHIPNDVPKNSVNDVYTDEDKHVVLRNNVKMPILGLGTSHSGGYSHEAVVYSLTHCNYRLIDTAKRYGVEGRIAEAIQESGVPREHIFLSTKCWPTDYGVKSTRDAFKGSCQRFATEYLDLYLLHWPVVSSECSNRRKLLRETWRELEVFIASHLRLDDADKVRSIGVSNFNEDDLNILLEDEELSVSPHINQCEFHPYHNNEAIRWYCQDVGVQFQGFCPLGNGALLQDSSLLNVARGYNRSVAQVLIRWNVQHNVVCIPKSTKKERVLQNSQVFDFSLSTEDMKTLDNMPQTVNIFDRETIQVRVDNPQPDGYRL